MRIKEKKKRKKDLAEPLNAAFWEGSQNHRQMDRHSTWESQKPRHNECRQRTHSHYGHRAVMLWKWDIQTDIHTSHSGGRCQRWLTKRENVERKGSFDRRERKKRKKKDKKEAMRYQDPSAKGRSDRIVEEHFTVEQQQSTLQRRLNQHCKTRGARFSRRWPDLDVIGASSAWRRQWRRSRQSVI